MMPSDLSQGTKSTFNQQLIHAGLGNVMRVCHQHGLIPGDLSNVVARPKR